MKITHDIMDDKIEYTTFMVIFSVFFYNLRTIVSISF